ncbi:hypothetical protein [Micromonospora sp. WMMD998]|uniref:hypothetical protein n=1 Tax=Micromonospora sp. WMMD998 TaxID=3016092 RepID=UPI00249B158D|nr:hypothetical protein [Micromonospora sp. WMMD998]WFE39659.1 hypothetical protein O7619_14955 [Micromonospora sp. WMMD998]
MSESRGPNDPRPNFPEANPPSAGSGAQSGPGMPGPSGVPGGGAGGPASAPRSGGRGLVVLALGVAGLALLLALGSAIFAWRAIDQAQDAKDIALRPGTAASPSANGEPGGSAPPPTSSAPTETEGTTPDDTPRSPGEAPALDERTVYRPSYQKEPLVLQAACSYSMYVDLDEPRTRNDSTGADIRFTRGCGNEPSTLRLENGVDGTDAASAGTTPQECAKKIRTALIGEAQRIPVRKGTAICITTDYAYARAHGDPWRMALIEVVGVSNDGSTTLQVTGWEIPDA